VEAAITLVVGLIAGLLARHWYTLYAHHPKLVVNGSGGWPRFVTLANLHSYFGIRPKYLHLFGRTLIRGDRIFGEVVERRTTQTTGAWMRDLDNPKRALGLVFCGGETEYLQHVEIKNDQAVKLLLFSRIEGEPDAFMWFEPPGQVMYGQPVVFDGTRTHRFEVTVRYSGRTRPKTFRVTVESRPGGDGPKVLTPDCFYGPRDRPR